MSEPSTNPMRRALRAMTHGMYVLSVCHEARDEYIVVALAMQCSVEPPRIAFAVSVNSRILASLRAARSGVLSVLGQDSVAAVRKYGTPGGVRGASANEQRTGLGHAVPAEASFWMELADISEAGGGDHILFVATVLTAGAVANDSFEPLTLAGTKLPYAG